MKDEKKIKQDIIDPSSSPKNKEFKFFAKEINKTDVISITKLMDKNNSYKKRNQKESKEISLFIKRNFLFNNIIILFLVQTLFKVNSLISFISKDSIVTLRVNKSGMQRIFNDGTQPDEIQIDNIIHQNPIKNFYDLNSTNIVKLIWTNNILHCFSMFSKCNSIIEMNFINFDASYCINTTNMFSNCHSLISLDLSGFTTSTNLSSIANIFWNCYSLISLNLSGFDTSQVTNFGHLFCNCNSLKLVDVSNLNTENAQVLDNLFYGCKSLISVNLSNFVTQKVINIEYMFYGCESLQIIDFSNLDITNITNKKNLNNVFSNCKNLEFIYLNNLKSNDDLNSDFFNGAKKNLVVYIKSENVQLINNLINNDSCRIIINNNYKYEYKKKCYNDCPFNSIKRENIKELEGLPLNSLYFCKPNCSKDLPYELVNKQECINFCDLKSILNKSCILNYKEEEKIENIKTIEIILDKIENFLTSNDYDVSNIERGNNEVMQYNNMAVTLTTTANQKKDENKKNVTTINLGDCEKKLKDAYNISDNETLFMRKIDSKEEGLMIPKIEFDVYYKLNGTNLVKLNLSHCSNSKIDISIPVKITDNIDKYNSSSAYYNDICYTATSDSGTDIILKDRKKEFMNNNRTVCQENCVFSEYDYNTSKVKCSCNIKESSSLLDIVKIDKQKLFDNFVDINNIGNLNLLFCYKVLFSKKGIIYNYGSYSLILIIIIHLTFIILFYVNNFYGKIQKILDSVSLGFNKTENLKVKDKKQKNKEKYNQKKYNDKKRQKTDEKENDSQKPQKNNNKIESKAKIIINNKKKII